MLQIFEQDRALLPFEKDINLRMDNYRRMRYALVQNGSLSNFANAHEYYGFHHTLDGWVYREWAPAADALYLMGDFNGWSETATPMVRLENGNWELVFRKKRSMTAAASGPLSATAFSSAITFRSMPAAWFRIP